ncbi:unnamed protein product [Rotaria magnacalcarata]|uniref:Uncharacterized protein n=1 Tax=Rotaria magnacalcarata TaxID=392030 RepID=A0A816MC88_9BILA|nr:unnamed protein product [Rotaria magnacalcarata]
MIARSQKWTGVFQADSKCDANACCCITGNKLATNYSTNTLEVVSDMIGLCQGVKILSTTCPYPNDCNDYVTVFNQNVALELNSDSSTIAFNNPNNPMCTNYAFRNSAIQQRFQNNMGMVALLFIGLTKILYDILISIRPHHSGLDLFSGQSADVASHEFKSDTFLRVAMSVLPVAAVLSYQIDAIWQLQIRNMYAGLSSTILHIFYFLQFYIHLKGNSKTIANIYTYVYHIIIWIFKTGGNITYFLYHHREKNIFHQCIFALRTLQDTIFISFLCIYKIRSYEPLICVQHKVLFSVISRLEIILAILVPIFAQENLVKRTVANISLFILYDFFSVYYHLFTLRLKWALWLFVVFITISVANEWLYFVNHQWNLCDQISAGFELLAECACCLLIIWQFRSPMILLPSDQSLTGF